VHRTFTRKQVKEYAASWGVSESEALRELERIVVWSE